MKHLAVLTALMGLPLLRLEAADAIPSPEVENQAGPVPGEARTAAMASASGFTKEGFRIRDGEWNPSLTKGIPVFLRITLFAGEEYGFAAASAISGVNLALTVFDASGKEVKSGPIQARGDSRVSVRVAPGKSGVYFVKLELLETPVSAPVEASLVYAYK